MYQKLGLGEYFGSPVRRRQAHGFVVTENNFTGGLSIPRHEHALTHFTCVLAGGFTETYGKLELECPASSVLFVPSGMSHCDTVWQQGSHTISIEIAPKRCERLRESLTVLDDPRVIEDASMARLTSRLYAEFRSEDSASLVALASVALDMLVTAERLISPNHAQQSPWIQTVMEALHANPLRDFSLAELAASAGVHEAHLSRTFRRLHGCSVGEYVRWLKLEEAKRKLSATGDSLGQIALEVGFYDQAHFSRAFRKAYGLSPSAYRKTMHTGM